MKKIGIMADSSSGLAYAPFEHHIKITKTTIHFGDETLIDGVDINADDFYLRLEKDPCIPKTSAPETREILNQIDILKNEGCTYILHFPISTNLSEYGRNLKNNIDSLLEDVTLDVIDTKAATLLQGYMAYFAEKLIHRGYDIGKVKEEVQKLRQQSNAYFVVDDLKYLIKNGRLSQMSGTVGILAKIKPILCLDKDGRITTKEKVRVHSKAIKRMYEIIKEETKDAKKVVYMVLHTNRLDDALNIEKMIQAELDNVSKTYVSTITPTVGAHIGSKILGIGYVIVDDYDFL